MADRGSNGRFAKRKSSKPTIKRKQNDHNYSFLSSSNSFLINTDTLPKPASRTSWKDGRRIIDLGFLMNQLEYCRKCRLGPVPLTACNIEGELKKGLGGYLYVRCDNVDCCFVNRVAYGKTHKLKKGRGMPCFTANTKLGIAMIDSVGGHVKVNNMLSTLNLQTIDHKNLDKMEQRAGRLVETVAEDSERTAAQDAFSKEMIDVANEESKEVAKNMDGLIDDLGVCPMPDTSPSLKDRIKEVAEHSWSSDEEAPARIRRHKFRATADKSTIKARSQLLPKFKTQRSGMSCAVDTAWQKRGFDSLTSHTFFMSKAKYGKKVVKSVVSHRQCSTCSWWRRHKPGQPVRQHKCVRNHQGSARLMESVSGEKGVLDLAKEGTPIEYLEGDGDTTLIARLKNNQGLELKKRFDKNHVMKNIGKTLYALSTEKNVKIGKSSISHLQKCISYALAKNSGDENGLRENLQAIVPHNFGEHNHCHPRFCEKLRSPEVQYMHRSLPHKAPLNGDVLRKRLDEIMCPVIAKAGQLIDLGCSQQCEHANREVSLKAPKNIHYGSTQALDFRVRATSAFINEGRQYIMQVNKEAGISPGKYTEQYAAKCAKKRKHTQEVSGRPSAKRRRLILKQERAVNQFASESLEGSTYQSGIGHEDEVDIDKVPDPVPRGVFKPVVTRGPPSYVVFDLETTDLIRGDQIPHITQLAAKESTSGKSFNRYIVPKVPISANAEMITKIHVISENEMLVNGVSVKPAGIHTALTDFFMWLKDFNNPFLVAHNGRRFDFTVLISACESCGLGSGILEHVSAFVDTLPVFKATFPGRTSYKQEDLASGIGVEYNAHNAEDDVNCLSKLVCAALKADEKCLVTKSFPPKDVKNNLEANKQKRSNMPSLTMLVASGVMKNTTAENIASSGLNFHHLKVIHKRQGEDGLRSVFTMRNSEGQPRVTNVKKVLDSVLPKLADFFEKLKPSS